MLKHSTKNLHVFTLDVPTCSGCRSHGAGLILLHHRAADACFNVQGSTARPRYYFGVSMQTGEMMFMHTNMLALFMKMYDSNVLLRTQFVWAKDMCFFITTFAQNYFGDRLA